MTIDFFNPVLPSLPRLGDTPYAYTSASARSAAGLDNAAHAGGPVVYVGSGEIDPAAPSTPPTTAEKSLSEQTFWEGFRTGFFGASDPVSSVMNHFLLGAAGIAVLAIGTYWVIKGD